MEYQVEFRNEGNPEWELDNEFESLGEAMSYATSQALVSKYWEHRITMQVTVMTYPPLVDFA